jgi:large conductance mechanosensitive channel
MRRYFREFKEFAVKGNVIDLAVAVIVGGAFGKIISSFVADVVMPPLGLLLGGSNLADWKILLKKAILDGDGVALKPAVNLNIGLFLQNVLDFVIIALAIFIMIKVISRLKRQLRLSPDKPKEEAPTPLSKDQELLTEIRDLLKK